MTYLISASLLSITLPIIVSLVFTLTSSRSLMDREKSTPFECGFDPYHTARTPFSLRFFLLAIIFIVFDIEIVLLMPLPLITNLPLPHIFFGALIFICILLLGLYYEWAQGSLNWSY